MSDQIEAGDEVMLLYNGSDNLQNRMTAMVLNVPGQPGEMWVFKSLEPRHDSFVFAQNPLSTNLDSIVLRKKYIQTSEGAQ